MKRTLAALAAVAIATGVALLPLAARDTPKTTAEHQAVQKVIDNYAAAYSQGDPQAVARLFTTDAEYVKDNGQACTAAKPSAKAARATLHQFQGSQTRNQNDLLPAARARCVLGANRGDGQAARRRHDDDAVPPDRGQAHGEWLIAEAREGNETASAAESSAPLDALAWMIGEWVDTSDRVDVHISCDWFANKHFLVRSFSVTTDGQMDLQGTEIVGYDPTTKQIRSWVFDSDGSFSEGVWTQQGKSWSESMKGTWPTAGGLPRSTPLRAPTPTPMSSRQRTAMSAVRCSPASPRSRWSGKRAATPPRMERTSNMRATTRGARICNNHAHGYLGGAPGCAQPDKNKQHP